MHLENMSRRGGGKGSTDSKGSDTTHHPCEDAVRFPWAKEACRVMCSKPFIPEH